MSEKFSKPWSEREEIRAILLFNGITNFMFFFFPSFSIIYLADVYVILSSALLSFYILRKNKVFKLQIKKLSLLLVIGSISTGLSLTTIILLISYISGKFPLSIWELLIRLIIYIFITSIIITSIIWIANYFFEQWQGNNSIYLKTKSPYSCRNCSEEMFPKDKFCKNCGYKRKINN